jgi:hypothetical protein
MVKDTVLAVAHPVGANGLGNKMLLLIGLLRGTNIYAWSFMGNLLPELGAELGGTVAIQAPVALEAGMALSCVLIAPVSDGLSVASRRTFAVGSSLLWALTMAAAASVSNAHGFIILHFFAGRCVQIHPAQHSPNLCLLLVQGVSAAQFGTLGMAAISDLATSDAARSDAVSSTGLSNGIAAVIAPLLSGGMSSLFGSWRAAFFGSCGIGLIQTMLVAMVYPTKKRDPHAAQPTASGLQTWYLTWWTSLAVTFSVWPKLLTSPQYLSYAAADIFLHVPVFVWGWGAAKMLIGYFGYSTLSTGIIYSLAWGLPMTVGIGLTPRVYQCVGESNAYVYSSLVSIFFAAPLPLVGSMSSPADKWLPVVFIVLVACMFVPWGVTITSMYDLAPRQHADSAATAVAFIYIVQAAGSIGVAELFNIPILSPENPLVIGSMILTGLVFALATHLVINRIARLGSHTSASASASSDHRLWPTAASASSDL